MDANQREHEEGLILRDDVYRVVGAAIEVSNHLGGGFPEAMYLEALGIELADREIPHVQQQRIRYKNVLLAKDCVADLVCCGKIIVEIEAMKQLTSTEEAQRLDGLKATKQPIGLSISFGTPKLEWKRYANTRNAR